MKSKRIRYESRWLIFHSGPFLVMDRGVGWSYAERNGTPVLRWEVSWRKINGVRINCRWFGAFVIFRRSPKWR